LSLVAAVEDLATTAEAVEQEVIELLVNHYQEQELSSQQQLVVAEAVAQHKEQKALTE
jgi:hypothetical protein